MSIRVRAILVLWLMAGLAGFTGALAYANGNAPRAARRTQEAPRAVERPAPRPPFEHLDLTHPVLSGERMQAPLEAGMRAELTVEPELQTFVDHVFDQYSVPFGSVVALDPHTGRVLAYVNHSSANPNAGDLAIDATPPAASVFKIITGAALVDAGQGPGTRVCYSGGESRLTNTHLGEGGATCATLTDAMGGSINAIFAKLADRNLQPSTLQSYASRFGFGRALPFDVPTQNETMEIPTERLEFARTSAGFWHTHMSPLHGALIAATIANDGRMPRAYVVDRVIGDNERELYRATPGASTEVISAATAHSVNRMMQATITQGTSRRTFHDPAGVPFLPGISIAGKTGTLSAENPYRGYTWWVGFAPADHPRIALAALVVNTPNWRIKANYVARETLRHYLVTMPAQRARRANATASATQTRR